MKFGLSYLERACRTRPARQTDAELPLGCKRVLLSSDYLPGARQTNVEVVTTASAPIERRGDRTTDGARAPGRRMIRHRLPGRRRGLPPGVVLVTTVRISSIHGATVRMRISARALPGYPEFFMVVGPNTGLGHNSMMYMIESQVEYVLRALKTMNAGTRRRRSKCARR